MSSDTCFVCLLFSCCTSRFSINLCNADFLTRQAHARSLITNRQKETHIYLSRLRVAYHLKANALDSDDPR